MAAASDDDSGDPLRPVKRQRVRRNARKRDQKSEDLWFDAEAKEKLDAEVRRSVFRPQLNRMQPTTQCPVNIELTTQTRHSLLVFKAQLLDWIHSCEGQAQRCVRLLQVEEKFKAAIDTNEIRQRIQDRLVLERAQMESEVEAKIAEERRVQLQRKRKEREQRLKDQVRNLHMCFM